MTIASNTIRKTVVAATVMALAMPLFASAQTSALGGKVHPTCIPWAQCVQQGKCDPKKPPQCAIQVPNAGTAIGLCQTNAECKGTSASGVGGQAQQALQLFQSLAGLIKQLTQGSGGGSQGGGAPSSGARDILGQDGQQQTGVSDQILGNLNSGGTGSAGGGTGDVTDLLRSAFGGDSSSGTGQENAEQGGGDTSTTTESEDGAQTSDGEGTGDGGSGADDDTTSDGEGGGAFTGGGQTQDVFSSERGEIRETEDGATIIAGVRDAETNTEVGGFYGVPGSEGAAGRQTLIGRLCSQRPWANGILSPILPDGFFDGICESRGYTPGQGDGAQAPTDITELESRVRQQAHDDAAGTEPVPFERGIMCSPEVIRLGESAQLQFACGDGADLVATAGFVVPSKETTSYRVEPTRTSLYGIQCSDDYTAACQIEVIDPQVTIWAEPQEVQLSARTTIFWNSKDVESCTVTGPSFNETGRFGGASTVAINDPGTDASTYELSCTTSDGATTTASVTVELAL